VQRLPKDTIADMEPTGWIEVDGCLRREFRFRNFSEAFAFLTRVAMLAERQDHHPTITNTWNRVTLELTSHDAGNTVTERDRKLATSIDALLA
jgi:4a-hydroxytetrahydrobiopterin dehydratase